MKKEASKLSTFINTLINILFIPVLVLALFSSVLMFTAKKHNEVPSLFGYSSVYILTKSMEPDFKAGSHALVKAVDTDTLKVGDIIAFYAYYKEEIPSFDLTDQYQSELPASTADNVPTSLLSFLGAGTYNTEQDEAIAQASKVLFHRITYIHSKVEDDNSIHRYFVTKGDNNSANDYYAIKDTMVVGVYVENAGFMANIFKFAGSSNGIILLVIIPSGILLLLLSQSIIEQIAKLAQERYSNEVKAKKVATFYEQEQTESIMERKQSKLDTEKQVKSETKPVEISKSPEQTVAVSPKEPLKQTPPKAPPKPATPPKAPPAPPKMPPKN